MHMKTERLNKIKMFALTVGVLVLGPLYGLLVGLAH